MSSLQLLVVIIGCGDADAARVDEQASSARVAHDHRRLWYRDADGDAFGDPDQSHRAFTRPRGFAVKAGDCDDAHAAAHPGATEALTDGLDDDCDGQTATTNVEDLPVWEAVPTRTHAELGITLTTDADVNGDGMADLVLGGDDAVLDGTTRSDSVTIFYGPLDASGGTVDENDASSILYGPPVGDGSTVCSVGDLEGDGVDDLVIGGRSEGSAAEGFAYIARGPLEGAVDLTLDAQAYEGADRDQLGGCAGPGDVDGDGLPDVVLSAPQTANGDQKGIVYLLRGPAEQASLEDADQVLAATDKYEYVGFGVAALGDLNGDGTGDYGISNLALSTVPADGVATYLITDFAAGTMHPRDAGVTVHSDYLAHVEALQPNRVGDVNDDGYDDVGIGLFQTVNVSDTMYILLGPFDDDDGLELFSQADIKLKTLRGTPNSWLSFAAALGDWNGDGTRALAVADAGLMPDWAHLGPHCAYLQAARCSFGAVFIMTEPIDPGTHDLETEADRIEGAHNEAYMGGSWYGSALDGGSDLNGDGAPDMAFSAWYADGAVAHTGRAYVLFGGDSF